MSYIPWATLYEGPSDASYFDVIIPRVLETLALAGPRLPTIPLQPAVTFARTSPDDFAARACELAEAFDILFIHADTGGRGQETGLQLRSERYAEAFHRTCAFPRARCVTVAPRHETEAWVLADPAAVMNALGHRGRPVDFGLPEDAAAAERIVDPKHVLQTALTQIRGRRSQMSAAFLYPAIAQRQNLDALRRSRSYRDFETALQAALRDLQF